MRDDVLDALAQVGTYPDENDNVRLYHATDEQAADAIVAERLLRPQEPEDPAERMLRRGGGSVFLSTSPDIAADLGKGSVVLAVDVPVKGTPAEVSRAGWGDPPPVELEIQLRAGDNLLLAFADRPDPRRRPRRPPGSRAASSRAPRSEQSRPAARRPR